MLIYRRSLTATGVGSSSEIPEIQAGRKKMRKDAEEIADARCELVENHTPGMDFLSWTHWNRLGWPRPANDKPRTGSGSGRVLTTSIALSFVDVASTRQTDRQKQHTHHTNTRPIQTTAGDLLIADSPP